MKNGSVLLSLAVGVTFAATAAFAAQKIGITDVRVGPTAAISIATSADGSVVYIAHGNGVFKSTDGGETWKKLPIE